MSEDDRPHPLDYRRPDPPPQSAPRADDPPRVIDTRIPIEPPATRYAHRETLPPPPWADYLGIVACLAGLVAWVFLLHWVTGGAGRWGVVGMLILFVAGLLTFLADLISFHARRSRWTTYACYIALSAAVLAAGLKVALR